MLSKPDAGSRCDAGAAHGAEKERDSFAALGQIDFERRTLTVGESKTEGGRGRVIPLNQVAFNALARWAGRFTNATPEHFVFPACESSRLDLDKLAAERVDPARPIKDWRTAWRTAVKRAGLRFRFHDLRHCCVTKLAESQTSEQTIMAIAGHLSRKMLEHYSHIRMQAKRTALEAIARPGFGMGVHQIGNQVENAQQVGAAKLLN